MYINLKNINTCSTTVCKDGIDKIMLEILYNKGHHSLKWLYQYLIGQEPVEMSNFDNNKFYTRFEMMSCCFLNMIRSVFLLNWKKKLYGKSNIKQTIGIFVCFYNYIFGLY